MKDTAPIPIVRPQQQDNELVRGLLEGDLSRSEFLARIHPNHDEYRYRVIGAQAALSAFNGYTEQPEDTSSKSEDESGVAEAYRGIIAP